MEQSYQDYFRSRGKKSTADKKDFKVGYFNSLKNDGDEAVVRFDYDTADDFTFQTVHKVKVKNAKTGKEYEKRVACVRKWFEPKDNCPLCASGNKSITKFYTRLVEYTTDANGKVVGSAKIWERTSDFTQIILSALKTGVDLGFCTSLSSIRDVIFKIRRIGDSGNKETTYTVTPMNPSIYKPEVYVKNFDDFNDFDITHHSVSNKSVEDIKVYLSTGEFPSHYVAPTEDDADKKEAIASVATEDITDTPVRTGPRNFTL